MRLIDPNHSFFRPLWVRAAVVAVCLGWAVFEFLSGAPFWGVLFAGMGLYAAWEFRAAGRRVPPVEKGKDEP